MGHDAHQHHVMPTDGPVEKTINHQEEHMHAASGAEHGSMGHMMSMAVRHYIV